jgi:hypothetical protein
LIVTLVLAASMFPLSAPASAGSDPGPFAALRHHAPRGADIVAARGAGSLRAALAASPNSGFACPAEPSSTGNVQVNCQAEDAAFPLAGQNETTVSVYGSKVVVGFNDQLVCCDQVNLSGYSVSADGGRTFVDRGDLPWSPDIQPIGDPSVVHDGQGNFYYSSLALSSGTPTRAPDSLISVYRMKAGSNAFQLMSVPVNVGDSSVNFADKDLLEVARDSHGKRHFYLTWTSYTNNSFNLGAVMLTDSTDGIHWRTMQVSPGTPCQPLSPASHPIPTGDTVYVSYMELDLVTCTTNPNATKGQQVMATVDLTKARVIALRKIATLMGAGDVVEFCGQGFLQVIQTEPGHNIRSPELPSSTSDENGVLYDVWADRPAGPGGGPSNATRIYLSYSTDGNKSWSRPRVISAAPAASFMNDRFQPWVVADEAGVHVNWYERVKAPSGGPDWLRTDKIDLSLATDGEAPRAINEGEKVLSSVPFPVIDTGGGCYMGDYNQIATNGEARFVAWGDNRNQVATPDGLVNPPDVFMAAYGEEGSDNRN